MNSPMRSDPMDKETVLAIIERDAIDAAAYRGYREETMLPGERQWHADRSVAARATVEGLWEERERLQATLNNTLAERDAAEHVAQSSRISAIDAESRATRAEAALEKAELQLGCADDYAREWKAHCEAAEAALKEAGACGPIERDEGFDRTYIPLPAGWEVQTKGKGSTFRICEPDGHRLAIPNEPYLHETLERMAREINAACRPTPPTVTVEAPKDGR
jgi:hypothetical protein